MEVSLREAPRGGGRDTFRSLGGPVWGRRTISIAAADGWRDRNAYFFTSTVTPKVCTAVLRGVARRGMVGRTERGSVIN